VEIQHKSLNIPLYKKNWSRLWFAFASVGIGWFWHKPTQLPAIAISCVVGGLTVWLTLGPGFTYFKFHNSIVIRWVTFIVSLFGLLFVMNTVIPFLYRYVGIHP
jgi:hypothetical protein